MMGIWMEGVERFSSLASSSVGEENIKERIRFGGLKLTSLLLCDFIEQRKNQQEQSEKKYHENLFYEHFFSFFFSHENFFTRFGGKSVLNWYPV